MPNKTDGAMNVFFDFGDNGTWQRTVHNREHGVAVLKEWG